MGFLSCGAHADAPPGVQSPYTAAVKTFLEKHDAEIERATFESALRFECYSDSRSEFAIGVRQTFLIQAPLSEVIKVLDGFSDYTSIFDGMRRAEVKSEFAGGYTFFTEQDVPVPFVPNERNEMIYRVDQHAGIDKSYRYQLLKSNHLKYNDGLIVVKTKTPGTTLYDEIDFWDADLGLAKTLGAKKVWKDSLEGIYQADLAVQLKAEKKEMTNAQILKASKKQAAEQDFNSCISSKKPFQYLGKTDAHT